jgi:hypothetical protein
MPKTARFYLALTEAVVPVDELGLDVAERQAIVADVAGFVQGQAEALPRRLGLLFGVGTAVFRFYVRVIRFRSFCGLPTADRRRIVESWAYGPVGLFRNLFKLIRSTALLAFFEAPAVREALDRQAETARGPGNEDR